MKDPQVEMMSSVFIAPGAVVSHVRPQTTKWARLAVGCQTGDGLANVVLMISDTDTCERLTSALESLRLGILAREAEYAEAERETAATEAEVGF